ncbi:hypothetical protein E1292_17615 [Nonomuraea deserti]|uniref:Uncharacterized protein n=1 Tax=Nonomuraea deserti TaxID=1848322 RepID=A0A4R4VIE7_9ACTN|nr:hypothetical protein E1292_17615 [Nonomuraea deserti]
MIGGGRRDLWRELLASPSLQESRRVLPKHVARRLDTLLESLVFTGQREENIAPSATLYRPRRTTATATPPGPSCYTG